MLPRHGKDTLWRDPEFLKLWLGQTVSQFGSSVTLLALPLAAALTLHASALGLGLLRVAAYLPFLVVGLFAGVWADRLPQHPIMIVADLGRAALLLAIPLAALVDRLSLALLAVVAFFVGTLSVLFSVAYGSFLPTLVGREHLVEGNGKLQLSESAAEIAGPLLGGALVSLLTAPLAILLDALSFLASVASLVLLRAPARPAPPRPEGRRVWNEIGEGLGAALGDPLLRGLAGCAGTWALFDNVLYPTLTLYVLRELRLGPGALGLVYAAAGVGTLSGALSAERLARRYGPGPAIVGGATLSSVGSVLIPLAGGPAAVAVPTLLAGQFLMGLGYMVFQVNGVSLRQAVTPDHLQGRVNASARFVSWVAVPTGALAGGILARGIGLRPTLWIAAFGGVCGFLWVLLSPLRWLRERPTPIEKA